MKVKICGITNLKDAFLAADAGADAVGFIFYQKSSRYIAPKDAFEICKKLPPFIKKVGVFVNEEASAIDKISQEVKIDLAQIHFEADEELFLTLKTPYIKVVRAKQKDDIYKFSNEYRLIDAFTENFGGEGKKVDLSWFENIDCSKIILAGGLEADTLKDTKIFGFYGVDVNSGVERKSGQKDTKKVYDFIKSAKFENF